MKAIIALLFAVAATAVTVVPQKAHAGQCWTRCHSNNTCYTQCY